MLPKTKRLNNFELKNLKDLILKKVFTDVGTFLLLNVKDKYAVTMSSKVFKTAVARNRARRLFYNYIKENKKNPSIVLQAKKNYNKAELEKEFQKILDSTL